MTAISISSKIRFVAVTAAAGLLFASALVLSAPRVAVAGGAGDPAGFVRVFASGRSRFWRIKASRRRRGPRNSANC